MRVTLVSICVLAWCTASAQATNSPSKDSTFFYRHSLDSAISIIKKEKTLHTLFMTGKECVKPYLPTSLGGVDIMWISPKSRKNKKRKMKEGEMIMFIHCLSISTNEVVVNIVTPGKGDWLYQFIYYAPSNTNEYILRTVRSGIVL